MPDTQASNRFTFNDEFTTMYIEAFNKYMKKHLEDTMIFGTKYIKPQEQFEFEETDVDLP